MANTTATLSSSSVAASAPLTTSKSAVQPSEDSTGLEGVASLASSSKAAAAQSAAHDEAAPTLRTGESSKTLLAAQRHLLDKSYAKCQRKEVERASEATTNTRASSRSEALLLAVGWTKESGDAIADAQSFEDTSDTSQRPSSQRTPSYISNSSPLASPATPQVSDAPIISNANRRASSSGSVTSRSSIGTRIQFSPSVRIANALPPAPRQRKPPAVLGGNIALAGGWRVSRNVLAQVRAKQQEECRARQLAERNEALSKGSAGRGGAGNRRSVSAGNSPPKTATAASERKPFGFSGGGGVRALVSGRWKSSTTVRSEAEEQRKQAVDKMEEEEEEEEEEGYRDVFAPIHPNGPFGAPLPVGADQGPALNATVVHELPAPPRAFYPGTLILIRSPSREVSTDGSQNEGESQETQEVITTLARSPEQVELDPLATCKLTAAVLLDASVVPEPDLVSSEPSLSQTSTTLSSTAVSPSQARHATAPSFDALDFQLAPDERGRVLWAGPPHEPEAHAEYADDVASLRHTSRVRRRLSRLLVARRPKDEVVVLRNEEGEEAFELEEKPRFWKRSFRGRHARSVTLAAPEQFVEQAHSQASAQAQAQVQLQEPKSPKSWSLLRRTTTQERRASLTPQAPPSPIPSSAPPNRARIITSREVDAMPPILFHRPTPTPTSPAARPAHAAAAAAAKRRGARPGTADAVMHRQPFLMAQQADEVVLQKRVTPWDLELGALREFVSCRGSVREKTPVAVA